MYEEAAIRLCEMRRCQRAHLAEITGKAIRLGRLLTDLRPKPEVKGLLALKLLRNPVAPREPTGELISLDDQDRALWNWKQIAEGFP